MINEYFEIIPWNQYFELLKKHFNMKKPSNIDDYYMSVHTGEPINTPWYKANEWWKQYLDDKTMLGLLEDLRPFDGELVIVTEASWLQDLGAFKVRASNLKIFVEKHETNFNCYFFDGDTLIINLEEKLIWILHHEGMYALIDHNQR